jgi:hypothetical protein
MAKKEEKQKTCFIITPIGGKQEQKRGADAIGGESNDRKRTVWVIPTRFFIWDLQHHL